MKKLSALLLAGLLLSPAALLAASFEGKVHFKITTGKGAAQEMDYGIKNGVARIDVHTKDGGAPGIILDFAKKEITVLMSEQKMYMVRSIAGQDQSGAPDAGVAGGGSVPNLETTGTTEKILGYDCVKYVVKAKDSTTEVWLTDQLGAFLGFGPVGGGGMPGGRRGGASSLAGQAWEAALAGKDFFPLRVVTAQPGGKETNRFEVTAIEKKSLPDSDFTPPADWQKFDVGAMMRGMMPGGR